MKLETINAEEIVAIGYDAAFKLIQITFQEGRTVNYFGVPQYIYDDFLNAPSKSRFYQQNILNQYEYELFIDYSKKAG